MIKKKKITRRPAIRADGWGRREAYRHFGGAIADHLCREKAHQSQRGERGVGRNGLKKYGKKRERLQAA